MARFFAFFTLFHLSLTFFRPEVPFKTFMDFKGSQFSRHAEPHHEFQLQ